MNKERERKSVTYSFKCTEEDSVNLKIRLRYDNLQQTVFFQQLVKMYLSRHEGMLELVEKIKLDNSKISLRNAKKVKKDYKKGEDIMKKLGITDSDKSELFDTIESEYEFTKIIISLIFNVPKTTKIVKIASKSPKSPILLTTNALIAASFAEFL